MAIDFTIAWLLNMEDITMKIFYHLSRLGLCVVLVLICSQTEIDAQQLGGTRTSFSPLDDPVAAGISFQQITFQFDTGTVALADWGRMQVNPDLWSAATGLDSGFVNLFVHVYNSSAAQANAIWDVQNFYVPGMLTEDCPDTDAPPAGFDPAPVPGTAPPDSTIPGSPPPNSNVPTPQPADISIGAKTRLLSTYLDLRPTVEGLGRVDTIVATLLVSEQPLPVVYRIQTLARTYPRTLIQVTQAKVNGEGDWGQFARVIPNPSRNVLLVGPPPVPLPPVPTPDYPSDIFFPIEVFQNDAPNVECAWNQCVPMAHANVLGYLQERYNGGILTWKLSHHYIPGIGKVDAAGDIPFWTPVPANSVVANIDALTRRLGVINPNVGDPTLTRCQQIRGILGYLTAFGDQAKAVYRHQGSSPVLGAGNTCDNGTVPLGSLTSQRQGEFPTWQWIFEQLQKGRGVAMSFGRYDDKGDRKSGHMVRVWGAARHLNTNYLFTLDDAMQGDNIWGTVNTQWQVADTGSPGMPGVPDGRLNLDNTTWEIEFAISAEAKPTLNIP
jgi:hypothetical protein